MTTIRGFFPKIGHFFPISKKGQGTSFDIPGDTPYLSIFSPNAGKYGPEKTPYLNTFHAVNAGSCIYDISNIATLVKYRLKQSLSWPYILYAVLFKLYF